MDIPAGIVLWISLTGSAWTTRPPWTSPLGLCAVVIPNEISLANVATTNIPAGIVADIPNKTGLANAATTDIPAGIACCGYPQWDQLGQRGQHRHPRWDCVPWLFPTGSAWPMWPLRTSPLGLCAVANGISLANMATTNIPTGIVCCSQQDQLGQRGHHGHPCWDSVPWISPTGLVRSTWPPRTSLTGSAWTTRPPWTSPLELCAVLILDGISLANMATTNIPAGIVCRGYL